jgi:SAM-dependent methyltransferase
VSIKKKPLRMGNFVKASGQFLPFRNQIFDAMVLAQVLHHLPKPRQALLEVHRCLKKNGYVLIGENIEDNYLIRLGRTLYPTHDGIETRSDYSRFRKEGLKHLIQDSGFTILKEATGVVLWVAWYELTKRLTILRPLSFLIKKVDNKLEKALPNLNAQYYFLCTKKR